MSLGSSPLASVSIAAGKFLITVPAVTELVGRPNADISAGPWKSTIGSTLYDAINEPVADAADYIYANALGTCEMSLNPTAQPGKLLSYRASSSMGNGLIVRLLVDGTVIGTWAHALTTTDDLYSQTLTPEQTAQMASGKVTVQLTGT